MQWLAKFVRVACHPIRYTRRIICMFLGRNDERAYARKLFRSDAKRYIDNAGVFNGNDRESLTSKIVVAYHGVEKGLTMPNRRYGFGKDAILRLMSLLKRYFELYGRDGNGQILHAVGVLKAYVNMHEQNPDSVLDADLLYGLNQFLEEFKDVEIAKQPHVTKEEFYRHKESSFPCFAYARHTTRHYCGSVSEDEIKGAVQLAMTAPSACNRQPVRVHCISNKEAIDAILDLQSGNRGFGKGANKLLIVTGDLKDICWVDERYDIYTNCGIFIMNLCYALFYYEIAHCILNWSILVGVEKDAKLRKLAQIPDNEVVAALIVCGKSPAEFDVAASPRRSIEEVLTFENR